MLKLLILAGLVGTITFSSYSVLAKNDDNPGKSNTQSENRGQSANQSQSNAGGQSEDKQQGQGNSKTTTASVKESTTSANTNKKVRPTSCDPNTDWKSHGEYVSCVASLKLGGTSVSDAAKSDIGKKGYVASGSGTVGTPSATPVASDSGEASGSGIENENVIQAQVNVVVKNIQGWLKKLQSLFSF